MSSKEQLASVASEELPSSVDVRGISSDANAAGPLNERCRSCRAEFGVVGCGRGVDRVIRSERSLLDGLETRGGSEAADDLRR